VPGLLDSLRSSDLLIAAELRPPRAELELADGLDAWIDTYHAIRSLTRRGTSVFVTDSAVGSAEEDNLRHLVTNLGADAPRARVIPFLTTKHPLEYCLSYAERAQQQGFSTLVVLGGDRRVGAPRSVDHAWQLRQMIRRRSDDLTLGGWANPAADPERQVSYLLDPDVNAEFYLTQIVSHHALAPVERFLAERDRRGLTMPGLFGVFFYRSAHPRTLSLLHQFLPVPATELAREFAAGATAEKICARTLRALLERGVRHFYISNLPVDRAPQVLARIVDLVGVTA
jgi:5,10-methylenetetrahydrofolate reductase